MSNDLRALCEEHGIACTYDRGEIREKEDNGKKWRHVRYSVSLARDGKSYGDPFVYRMGLQDPPRGYGKGGFGKETAQYDRYLKTRVPDAASVVGSLMCDASCYESARDFADFCADFGHSTDSIRARDTYHACGETAKRIRAFLGDLFDKFQEAARDF